MYDFATDNSSTWLLSLESLVSNMLLFVGHGGLHCFTSETDQLLSCGGCSCNVLGECYLLAGSPVRAALKPTFLDISGVQISITTYSKYEQ